MPELEYTAIKNDCGLSEYKFIPALWFLVLFFSPCCSNCLQQRLTTVILTPNDLLRSLDNSATLQAESIDPAS